MVLPTDLTAPATVDAFLRFALQQVNAARAVHMWARKKTTVLYDGQDVEHVQQQRTVDDDDPLESLVQRRLQSVIDQPPDVDQPSEARPTPSYGMQRPLAAAGHSQLKVALPHAQQTPPATDELQTAASQDAWEPRLPSYAVLWRHFLRYHAQSSHATSLDPQGKAAVRACSKDSTLVPVDSEKWNVTLPLQHLRTGHRGSQDNAAVHDAVAGMWPAGCAVQPPLDLKLLVVAMETVLQELAQRPGRMAPSDVASEILALHVVLRREWDREALLQQ